MSSLGRKSAWANQAVAQIAQLAAEAAHELDEAAPIVVKALDELRALLLDGAGSEPRISEMRIRVEKPRSNGPAPSFESAYATDPLADLTAEWGRRYGISKKERDVFYSLMKGESRPAIAERMGIELETVDRHARHILQKTHDAHVSDALLRALREKILENRPDVPPGGNVG